MAQNKPVVRRNFDKLHFFLTDLVACMKKLNVKNSDGLTPL